MREVIPYSTVEGAARALDNGGRFFNLFSRINDDVVDSSELSKAAGATFVAGNALSGDPYAGHEILFVSVQTGLPESTCRVRGVMNSCALRVTTT